MKVFLGTNFGHGAAAAVVAEDGRLLSAVEEGRLLNKREYSSFPDIALGRIAREYGSAVAGWSEGWDALRRLFVKGVGLSTRFAWRNSSYLHERLLRETGRFMMALQKYPYWGATFGKVRFVGHHEAHAYSLLPWGLPEGSVVVVSDYIGEQWSLSCFYWGRSQMRVLGRVPFPHSFGAAYQQLATHLGFRGSTGPGRVMALAAYGEPRWAGVLSNLVQFNGPILRIDQRRFPLWRRRQAWVGLGVATGGALAAEVSRARDSWEHGRDLAASVQEWLTASSWHYIRNCVDWARSTCSLPVRALGLAGGCALNCQANGEFVRRMVELDLERLVVSPWSDDSGTAIGAAVHAALASVPDLEIAPTSAFIGPRAAESGVPSAEDMQAAVKLLAQGQTVAMGVGRLEFGPRALGGRAVLADAREPQMKRRLNQMKGRPAYMPFAPAVLAEDFGHYFEGHGSTNMAWTVRIREESRHRFPGMDHPSGQARVQLVSPDGPSVLRRLLEVWREQTGSSILLLTSLNGAGEAMPDTAERCMTTARRLGASAILLDHGMLSLS